MESGKRVSRLWPGPAFIGVNVPDCKEHKLSCEFSNFRSSSGPRPAMQKRIDARRVRTQRLRLQPQPSGPTLGMSCRRGTIQKNFAPRAMSCLSPCMVDLFRVRVKPIEDTHGLTEVDCFERNLGSLGALPRQPKQPCTRHMPMPTHLRRRVRWA